MLKMKNQMMGLALAAVLLAGCQTAPKSSYSFTDEQINETFYGNSEGVRRGLASIGGPIAKLIETLGKNAIKAKSSAAKLGAHDFVRFANTNSGKIAEVAALREAKLGRLNDEWVKGGKKGKQPVAGVSDRLTVEELTQLDDAVQARLTRDFMAAQNVKNHPSLTALYSEVDAMAKTFAKNDATMNTVSKEADAAAKARLAKNAQQTHTRIERNVKKAGATLDELLKRMEIPPSEYAEATASMKRALEIATELRIMSGSNNFRHFTENTCESLDSAALQRYADFLATIEKDLKDIPGYDRQSKLLKCKNVGQLTAWAVAKFQESLGRVGSIAVNTTEDMTACNFIDKRIAPAARTLATVDGKLGARPACE